MITQQTESRISVYQGNQLFLINIPVKYSVLCGINLLTTDFVYRYLFACTTMSKYRRGGADNIRPQITLNEFYFLSCIPTSQRDALR